MNFNELLKNLKTKGYRITKPREQVLKVLFDRKTPITASELLAQLSSLNKKVDKATVYRNLDLLIQENIINLINLEDNIARYELEQGHHHHFICSNCNKIIHIETKELESSIHQVEEFVNQKHKVTIKKHIVDFYGLCSDCVV